MGAVFCSTVLKATNSRENKLGDIEMILDSAHVPEDIANRAKMYWLGHIDGALFNRGEIVGRSFVSAEDTIEELNNFAEENS
jgi:hypothetical protein